MLETAQTQTSELRIFLAEQDPDLKSGRPNLPGVQRLPRLHDEISFSD